LKRTAQIIVPPGGTAVCPVEVKVYDPKPFEAWMPLHLEDNGIRTVTIKVKGVGVDRGGSENDKPSS